MSLLQKSAMGPFAGIQRNTTPVQFQKRTKGSKPAEPVETQVKPASINSQAGKDPSSNSL